MLIDPFPGLPVGPSIDVPPDDELVFGDRFADDPRETLQGKAGIALLTRLVVLKADARVDDPERPRVARALVPPPVEPELHNLLTAVVGVSGVEILGPSDRQGRPSCLCEVDGRQLAPTDSRSELLAELGHAGLE